MRAWKIVTHLIAKEKKKKRSWLREPPKGNSAIVHLRLLSTLIGNWDTFQSHIEFQH